MSDIYKYLSGNVPGGFALYLFLIIVIFGVLFSISRRNDLFTPQRFRIWFGVIWLAITAGYVVLWFDEPPETALHRYSTRIFTRNPADRWLAYYFRDEISRTLKPYRSATNYLYWQQWNLWANVDCADGNDPRCEEIIRLLPIDELITGEINRKGERYGFHLTITRSRSGRVEYEYEWVFDKQQPEKILQDVRKRLAQFFPLRDPAPAFEPADSLFVLAKEAFYRGEYEKSGEWCRQLAAKHPRNREIGKWYFYNQIRLAEELKKKDQTVPPPGKTPWQVMLTEARRFLIPLAKEQMTGSAIDERMMNMIAESFMLEEYFGDAEQFLKIAYGENPFDVYVLENISLLNPDRYRDLKFRDEEHLLSKILQICPIQENVLQRYVEALLISMPVSKTARIRAREALTRFLKLNPASPRGWLLWGKYQLAVFDYRAAFDAFLKADSLEPHSALVQYNLGVTAYRLKEIDQAEKYFQNAVSWGDYLDAHLYLGVIYQSNGEYQKALQEFRYRVAHKQGEDDYYALQAMKGIRECLAALKIPDPQ